MKEISRVNLFSKLNSTCYRTIENAAVFCKLRGNPYIEVAHWLHQLLLLNDCDLLLIIKHYQLDNNIIAKDLSAYLDNLPRGSTSISDISSQVEETVERGWIYSSLMFNGLQVRSGHLLIGIIKTTSLHNTLRAISNQFTNINTDDLIENFSSILEHSSESAISEGTPEATPGIESGAISPSVMGKQEALARFTVDLTKQAKSGKLDPIYGRSKEIRQIIDILMRRRQNNPLITGEAGVGKTAVVEGFAQEIVEGHVPPSLKDVRLLTLDIGLLSAGASMKGEFENRLRQVIEEVQASENPIILFIDEVHTLVGTGGQAGTGDAANLLKPALARGNLRTIGATTWAEYKKHIEKDPALTRRFQVVKVEEPDEEQALVMLRGLAKTMEDHHKIQLLDESLTAAVRLSSRYIPDRQLPDKAVSLLDTTCARVAVSQYAVPPILENIINKTDVLKTELEIIEREEVLGNKSKESEDTILQQLKELEKRYIQVSSNWEKEKKLFEKILNIRKKIRNSNAQKSNKQEIDNNGEKVEDIAKLQNNLSKLNLELNQLQGEQPLILTDVDYQAVALVVQDWTGIPVGRMIKNEIDNVLNLAEILSRRIIGQRHALEMIVRRIQTSRAGLDNPNKPIGVFMLAGTSGVGKTETALALAEVLYGGDQNIITINMSEYQEAHTVSSLKGAPPGYVGYGEGGVLTEAIRRRPYSIVLLDEVEKAHPDVHEIFFQVFDKGWMEDSEGRVIDFKNTIILLTTNSGTDLISQMCKDPELIPDADALAKALREPLLKIFPPALLGRLVVIPYYPLSDEVMSTITKLQLNRIVDRVKQVHNIPLTFDEQVIELIVKRCTEVESGGRMIDAIVTNSLLPRIGIEILTRMKEDKPIISINISVSESDFSYQFS